MRLFIIRFLFKPGLGFAGVHPNEMESRRQSKLAIQVSIADMVVLLSREARFHVLKILLRGDKTHLDAESIPNCLLYRKGTV